LNQEFLGKMDTMNHLIGNSRDELLNGEIFKILPETKILIEKWRKNIIRLDSIFQ